MRTRTTRDVWVLQVNYGFGHGWEDETEEETLADARAQRACYRENVPEYPARIVKRRERIVAAPTKGEA